MLLKKIKFILLLIKYKMKRPVHLFYLPFVFTILIAVSVLSSCKKSSSNKNTISVVGTWNGTVINTAESDNFSVGFTLTQSGTNIAGEFTTAAANGNVTGSVSDNSVVLTLTPAASSGYTEVDTFKGTINAAGTEVTGTFNSTANLSGTFDIKKQ